MKASEDRLPWNRRKLFHGLSGFGTKVRLKHWFDHRLLSSLQEALYGALAFGGKDMPKLVCRPKTLKTFLDSFDLFWMRLEAPFVWIQENLNIEFVVQGCERGQCCHPVRKPEQFPDWHPNACWHAAVDPEATSKQRGGHAEDNLCKYAQAPQTSFVGRLEVYMIA